MVHVFENPNPHRPGQDTVAESEPRLYCPKIGEAYWSVDPFHVDTARHVMHDLQVAAMAGGNRVDPLEELRRRGEQNLREMDDIIRVLSDPWHRQMADVVREHSRAEIFSELDAIMATLAPNPVYRFYGSQLFPPFEVNTTTEAYSLYKTIIDMGYPPAGAFDDQKWYFSDSGVALQMTPTTIVPGQFLVHSNPRLDAESPYQITYRLLVTHGFDRNVGLMQGEIVYFGDTLSIRKLDTIIAPRRTT